MKLLNWTGHGLLSSDWSESPVTGLVGVSSHRIGQFWRMGVSQRWPTSISWNLYIFVKNIRVIHDRKLQFFGFVFSLIRIEKTLIRIREIYTWFNLLNNYLCMHFTFKTPFLLKTIFSLQTETYLILYLRTAPNTSLLPAQATSSVRPCLYNTHTNISPILGNIFSWTAL